MSHESEGKDRRAPAVSTTTGEDDQPTLESHPLSGSGRVSPAQAADPDAYHLKTHSEGTEAPADLAGEQDVPIKRPRMGRFSKFMAFAFPVLLALSFLVYKRIKAAQKEEVLPRYVLPPVKPVEFLPLPKVNLMAVPPVETPEEQTSPTSTILRAALKNAVQQVRSKPPLAPSDEAVALMGLAKAVTEGTTPELIGRTITLTDFQAVERGAREEPGDRKLLITRFVAEGPGSVVLAVQDEKTAEAFTMRMSFAPPVPSGAETGPTERARQGVLQVCSDVRVKDAGPLHGLAAIRGTARIQGAEKAAGAAGQGMALNPQVQLMEPLEVDLSSLLAAKPLMPTGWKAFLARRCLKTVLHLQRAGLNHNQICSANFLIRPDGLIALSGFDSSVPFGSPIPPDVDFPTVTTDPALLRFLSKDEEGFIVRSDAQSDMWSLGLLLHEIMMDGELPYGLSALKVAEEPLPGVLAVYRQADPKALSDKMASEKVHPRWRELISRLLEPMQRARITAEEVARDFKDLLSGEIELEIFDVDKKAPETQGEESPAGAGQGSPV